MSWQVYSKKPTPSLELKKSDSDLWPSYQDSGVILGHYNNETLQQLELETTLSNMNLFISRPNHEIDKWFCSCCCFQNLMRKPECTESCAAATGACYFLPILKYDGSVDVKKVLMVKDCQYSDQHFPTSICNWFAFHCYNETALVCVNTKHTGRYPFALENFFQQYSRIHSKIGGQNWWKI